MLRREKKPKYSSGTLSTSSILGWELKEGIKSVSEDSTSDREPEILEALSVP